MIDDGALSPQSLRSGTSRRSLLGPLSSGLLFVSRGFAATSVAAKRCPACRKKKHGHCKRKKPNGTPCGEPCLECRNGKCVSACVPPATICGARTPGVCCIPDGGPCDPAHPEECCSTSCQPTADGAKCTD